MRIPPDLDVGDLALTAGSVARLVVLDPARVPVAGARVHAPGLHVAAAETDAEGRATLIGLPPNAQLEVLARGFDPVQFPTPPSDDLFEVVLARATRLKITVLGPLDAPAPGVHVRLSAGQRLFVQERDMLDLLLLPQPVTQGTILGPGKPTIYITFVTDAHGTVDLQSLEPGLALALTVEDELGSTLHAQDVSALRPAEEREIEIRLPGDPCELAGSVEDTFGQPVEGATVYLHAGGDDAMQDTTGADGRFQFERLFAPTAEIRVDRRGYVSARLSGLPIVRDAAPVRIVLEPGRDVRVSVIDERGDPTSAGQLSAWLGEERGWSAHPAQDGARLLRDLPVLELEVRLDLAGKKFRQALSAHAEALELRVPLLGRLEVTCEPGPELPTERLGLQLRSLDDASLVQGLATYLTNSGPAVFEAVLPGNYELSYATVTGQPGALQRVLLGTPLRVAIHAGETTRVLLR